MLRTILRLAAVAVVAAGAVVVGVNVSRDDQPGEGSADVGFARAMRTHHAQAVEMAELLRDRIETEDLRVVAADIALTQQAQIGQMQGWLDVWGVPPTGTGAPMAWAQEDGDGGTGGDLPGMATDEQVAQLERATGGRAEVLFLQLMIRHHEGGVSMALRAAELATEDEVRALADTIAQSQQAEIRYLAALLTARDAEPLPSILPADVGEISDDAAAANGSDDAWDLVADWWPVGVAGLVLLVLLRDLVRRPRPSPASPAPPVSPASIDPAPTPVATVGEAPDEHADRRTERRTERPLDPIEELERFPLDDSAFDDL